MFENTAGMRPPAAPSRARCLAVPPTVRSRDSGAGHAR